VSKKDGKPVWTQSPQSGKSVRFNAAPESTDGQSPAWQFHKRDKDHTKWGWSKLSAEDFQGILHTHLCQFETMTWAEILKASGGRTHGTNHHNIELSRCSKEAQKRLQELKSDDVDELFSLRINATTRLFGIKEGRVLRFIWHDPDHSVYQVKR